jgi:hypothetical protein
MSDTMLVCLGCGRKGRDPAYGGRCACGACNWLDASPDMNTLVDLTLVCLGCGRRGRRRALGGRCECGGRNWLETSPSSSSSPSPSSSSSPSPSPSPPPEASPPLNQRMERQPIESGLRALGADGARRLIVDDYPGSTIATVLEGIGRGMVVMLAGTAGVGKSTLAAQAGFVIARQTGACLYWLDADQLREELIEETFYRARCPPDGLAGRVFPVHEAREDGLPDFRRACARVPENGVAVIDSLEAWAPRGDKQALELLRVLRAHPCRVKLVVAATNAAGGVAGDGELERACDATVFVERAHLRVGKCRWTIGATWARRGPGGLEVERMNDEGAMDDVSEEEAEEAPAAAPVAGDASGDTCLSERERTALAKLLRWWPPTWKRMTARQIIDALAYGGLEDLGEALRELADASELTPANVGYALRWVKDKPLNGKALKSELDRKTRIARWGVVRVA